MLYYLNIRYTQIGRIIYIERFQAIIEVYLQSKYMIRVIFIATVFRDYAKIKKITGAVYDKNESVWKL